MPPPSSATLAASAAEERALRALDRCRLELPSWAFAASGTRFGTFPQPAAAATLEEKLADAGQVHAFTGCCPTIALHAQWDLPAGTEAAAVLQLAARYGLRPGSLSPTLFQDPAYQHGSLANEQAWVRERALDHILDTARMGQALGARAITLWFADGSSFPGSADMRQRKRWLAAGLARAHAALAPSQRLLLEYKPFEPASYHTDVADWGMALLLARAAGPQARVLVDVGHHYPSQNIEQIVAWLLDEGMLGGFHLNDRRYADDDLTFGSIDPYQAFRIVAEIAAFERQTGADAGLVYAIDQCHNVKDKIEEAIQTALNAQELWVKAALVDYGALDQARRTQRTLDAENLYRAALFTDVQPLLRAWRRARGLPEDPLAAFRASGYRARIARERAARG